MFKVLVFDIDDTLLNSQHEINESSIVAIKYAKSLGIKVIFCSGRPYFDMEKIEKVYQIADYMICNNGAYWFDVKKNEFHFKTQINEEIAFQVIEEGKKYCSLLALHTDKATYRSKLCDDTEKHSWFNESLLKEQIIFFHNYNTPFDQILQKIKTNKIMQLAFKLDKQGAKQLAQKIRHNFNKDVDVVIANEVYVDINPRHVNKFTGLENWCKAMNYSPQEIIAFGDSGNDLEMLKYVGYGICMANGTVEAKKAAKEVIGDNDSNAISDKIYELMINLK